MYVRLDLSEGTAHGAGPRWCTTPAKGGPPGGRSSASRVYVHKKTLCKILCFSFMVCIYRDLGVPKNTSVFSGVLVFRRTIEIVDYIEVPS